MRVALPQLAAAAALSLSLAACNATTGIMPATEAGHVSRVHVSLAPTVSTQRFAELVRSRTMLHAARFGRAGAAKELRIAVDRINYQNPALSLLTSDLSYVHGRVAVIDVASGRVQGSVEAGAIDSQGIGGLPGAIISATQERQKLDERLADDFAKAVLRRALGGAIVDPVLYRDDPIIYTPPAKQAPAP